MSEPPILRPERARRGTRALVLFFLLALLVSGALVCAGVDF
ncbi:MAG TPA: hypothetical protein VK610_06640 [Rhodothermales bacterium]|nr:hypothetical protein [Rhodothermales bacterium]